VLIALAFAFLWLSFRGTDLPEMWKYAKTINWTYVALLVVSVFFSHFFRALRWQIMLNPLVKSKVSVFNCFSAIMYGYAINVVVPRGGEVARLLSIVKTEKLPWPGVLATMFLDRVLDLAFLVIAVALTMPLLPETFLEKFTWLPEVGHSLLVVAIVGLIAIPILPKILERLLHLKAISDKLPEKLYLFLKNLNQQFSLGTACLSKPINYPLISALSVFIWFFYWLNFYLIILAFNLGAQVDLEKTFIVFTIGSVGVLVPTPGSVGSFHYFVSQALVNLAGLNKNLAVCVAFVLHAISMILTSFLFAGICYLFQASRTKIPAELETEGVGS
jgi:uncharacterized protein (TIRG00374 family)